jgi:hypothetical protein
MRKPPPHDIFVAVITAIVAAMLIPDLILIVILWHKIYG